MSTREVCECCIELAQKVEQNTHGIVLVMIAIFGLLAIAINHGFRR